MQIVTVTDPQYTLMSDWEAAFLREYVCETEMPDKARTGALSMAQMTGLLTKFNAFDARTREVFKAGYEARKWEDYN